MKNNYPIIINNTNIENASRLNLKYKAIVCLGENSGVFTSRSIQWLSSILHK